MYPLFLDSSCSPGATADGHSCEDNDDTMHHTPLHLLKIRIGFMFIGPQEEGVKYNRYEAYPRVSGYNDNKNKKYDDDEK